MAIKTLFKDGDTSAVQDYITVDISQDMRTIIPYIKQAEKFVTDIVGTELYAELIDFVHNDETDEYMEALLPYVQLPLINFAYMLGAPKLSLNIGDTGITQTESNNLTPAQEWQMNNLKKSFASAGYDALEDLIKFLEDNRADYTLWESSDAYSFNKKFFVNNAKEFNDTIYTDIGRYDFLKLKPYIHQIEQAVIQPVMCQTLFDVIKAEILADNISEDNKTLLDKYIKPAVCYLSMDRKEANEDHNSMGRGYVEQLRAYLDENASTYTDYANSDCYEDPDDYEDLNDEDSSVYMFGSYHN